MARARLLKPGFFANEKLTEVPPFGRLLFAGLWTIADRRGRLRDSAKYIKSAVFPYENVPVEKLLQELSSRDFIERYEAEDGERLIQITNFERHQHVHIKEPESTLPAPYSHRTSPVISRSRPAEAVTKAEAEAEAVTPRTEMDWPEEDEDGPNSFRQTYKRQHEQLTGKGLGGTAMLIAGQLERKYGSPLCIDVAEAHGWDKHPNYYKGPLEDLSNGATATARDSNGTQTSSRSAADAQRDAILGPPRRWHE